MTVLRMSISLKGEIKFETSRLPLTSDLESGRSVTSSAPPGSGIGSSKRRDQPLGSREGIGGLLGELHQAGPIGSRSRFNMKSVPCSSAHSRLGLVNPPKYSVTKMGTYCSGRLITSSSMAIEKISRRELADLILQRLNIGGVDLDISRTAGGRWFATVRARPGMVSLGTLQSAVETVADELRLKYDLAD
jgi:hypothetical protein